MTDWSLLIEKLFFLFDADFFLRMMNGFSNLADLVLGILAELVKKASSELIILFLLDM